MVRRLTAAPSSAGRLPGAGRPGLAWLIPLASTLLVAGTLWCYLHNQAVLALYPDIGLDVFQVAVAFSYPLIGAFILRRRPGNITAWIFCGMGLFAALYGVSVQYPVFALLTLRRALPLAGALTWVSNWAWYVPIVLLTPLVMLYPGGRRLTRGWKLVLALVLAMIPLMIVLTWVYLWPYRGDRLLLPPAQLSAEQTRQVNALRGYLYVLLGVPVLVGLPSAVAVLLQRLRRAPFVERQQIKWFLYVGSLFTPALVLDLALQIFTRAPWVNAVLWNGVMSALAVGLPVTVMFAILRYRLFDIDLIIRRTLVYTLLTLILAATYLVSVIVLQDVLRAVLGQTSPVAVVLATLFIAALFTPLRRRVQAAIDRRFYRGSPDPQQVLGALSLAIQTEVDLETLSGAVLLAVEDALHPESKSLWIKKN